MSQALTLARPYARAAFALAKDSGRLPQWSQMLGFAAQAAAVPAAHDALRPPLAKADALVDLLLPPGDSDPNFRQFLVVLADNRRLPLLPEIAGQFDQLRAEAFDAILAARWSFILESRRSDITEIATSGASRAGAALRAWIAS